MHFYLPRRHRRRLLLPPGLVALAGLLLLGCLALRPWQELAKVHGVIQLTVPIYEAHPHLPTIRFLVPNPDTMCERRFRYQALLNGNATHDQRQYRRIVAAIRAITSDNKHNGLVCVQLASTARYENMVAMLDLVKRMNLHQHWFDFTRKPTSFYIFSSQEIISTNEQPGFKHMSGCLLYPPYTPAPVPPLPLLYRFNQAVIALWTFHWLAPLKHPSWRIPLVLLALLSIMNLWRLWALRKIR